jgi:Uma2 family endonuclease
MKPITDISQLDLNKKYTYADYLTWQFSERVELIKGWIHQISPAPRRVHQKIEGVLHVKIWSFFEHGSCEVYQSPFDVRLIKNKGQKDQEINTVVQPDICVICDETKLDDAGCIGAPDLIVEILSDSTAKKDYNEKFNLYEENEVKEYWIVNPATQTIEVFSLIEERYHSLGLFNEKDGTKTVQGNLFPELQIELQTIFGSIK